MQYLPRTILMMPALVLALLLAGCGQKGELYLDGDAAPSSQEAQAEEQDGEDDGD